MTTATATRFADNTTTNPVNRVREYGFAPGLKYMPVRGLVAGVSELPQGILILFKPRVEKYLNGEYRPTTQEFSAKEQAKWIYAKYVGGTAGDTGFRTLDMLTQLPYDKATGEDQADNYFGVVHPNVIPGGNCPMGLETNVGDVWQRPNKNAASNPCPTCRLEWLNSEACASRITAAVENGFDRGILEALRLKLRESYQAGWEFAKNKFEQSKGELAASAAGSPGKKNFDESDYHYMAMIHKKDPIVEQAELVTKQAEVQGRIQAESMAKAVASLIPQQPVAAPVTANEDVESLKAQIAEQNAKIEALLNHVATLADTPSNGGKKK